MTSSNAAPRQGQFSTCLVASNGGLAPAAAHRGLRPSQRQGYSQQSRQHLPTAEAARNMEVNAADTQSSSAAVLAATARARARKEPAPTGRRHVDPNHHMNLSDEAKRQEGRLGRAHVRPPRDSLTARGLEPAAAQPDWARATNRNTATSSQEAERRLRRLAAGRASASAAAANPQRKAAYEQAARQALDDHHGDPGALVRTEQAIQHRMASDAYASDSAQRQAAVAASLRRRDAGGDYGQPSALGALAARLQAEAPFAMADSTPRADTNTSVTGGGGIRALPTHNSDHFPITGRPLATLAATPGYEAHGRDSEGRRLAAEEARRQRNETHYEARGMRADRPYDDEARGGARYPTPPPVGVSVGVYQKPPTRRPSPGHRQAVYARGPDSDSLAADRARARAGAGQVRMNRESVSMDRPAFYVPRTETSQPQQQQDEQQHQARRRPTAAAAGLRDRTEARWRHEKEERDARGTGKGRGIASKNDHTPLW